MHAQTLRLLLLCLLCTITIKLSCAQPFSPAQVLHNLRQDDQYRKSGVLVDCRSCKRAVPKELLSYHVLSNHIDRNTFYCHLCGWGFTRESSRSRHQINGCPYAKKKPSESENDEKEK